MVPERNSKSDDTSSWDNSSRSDSEEMAVGPHPKHKLMTKDEFTDALVLGNVSRGSKLERRERRKLEKSRNYFDSSSSSVDRDEPNRYGSQPVLTFVGIDRLQESGRKRSARLTRLRGAS